MAQFIDTPRLLIRPFQPSDDASAFGWFADPRVMRYIPNGPDTERGQTFRRIAGYMAHQAAHGFSKWLIVDRISGRAIGDSGLYVLQKEGWIDLGFRLEVAQWGKGLATEAALAWTRVAVGELGVTRLGAFSHVENGASMRVLQKVGFEEVRRDHVMGIPAVVFSLAANDKARLGADRQD